METPLASRSITERMKGAAMLDVPTYEEVEADHTATGQAAAVVAMGAVASAIGASGLGGPGIIGGVIFALVSWLVWAGVTYVIGDKLLGGTATWGELLRTIGFAQTPRLLMVLGVIPGLRWLVTAVVSVWVLIAVVIAIRQALDFTTGKAIITALLGAVAVSIIFWALAWIGFFSPRM